MAELIINSAPSGAQVQLDGEIIGTTPITYSIDEDISLAEFRAECLSGGSVICSWNVLRNRLEDLTVSRLWWDLTRDERYSVAEVAIKNTLFYTIYHKRTGKPNCEGGEGDLVEATCVNNAIIRCLKFAEWPDTVPTSPDADECYYRVQPTSPEHCFVSEHPYKLPCHYVSRISDYATHHALAAIHIDDNYDSMDSWIVFQYADFDIKPGDSQMPRSSHVIFSRSHGFQCGVSYGTQLAEFWI